MKITQLTPQQMISMAYFESQNAIEFCNWYITNQHNLEMHERALINNAYHDGINDAIQDPDHTLRNGEYYTDNFIDTQK